MIDRVELKVSAKEGNNPTTPNYSALPNKVRTTLVAARDIGYLVRARASNESGCAIK